MRSGPPDELVDRLRINRNETVRLRRVGGTEKT